MKSGTCPKCGGKDIRTNRDNPHAGDHMFLGNAGFTGLYCHVYVCTACGYVEDYLPAEVLAKVREKWSRP